MESFRGEKRPGDPLENDNWGHDPPQPWGPPPLTAMKPYPMPKPAGSPRPEPSPAGSPRPEPPHSARSNASRNSLPSAVSYPSPRSLAPSPRAPEPADTSNRRAPKATPMAVPNHSPRTHVPEPSDTSNARVLGVTGKSAAKGHTKAEKRPPSPSEEDTANVPASSASTAKATKVHRRLK